MNGNVCTSSNDGPGMQIGYRRTRIMEKLRNVYFAEKNLLKKSSNFVQKFPTIQDTALCMDDVLYCRGE